MNKPEFKMLPNYNVIFGLFEDIRSGRLFVFDMVAFSKVDYKEALNGNRSVIRKINRKVKSIQQFIDLNRKSGPDHETFRVNKEIEQTLSGNRIVELIEKRNRINRLKNNYPLQMATNDKYKIKDAQVFMHHLLNHEKIKCIDDHHVNIDIEKTENNLIIHLMPKIRFHRISSSRCK